MHSLIVVMACWLLAGRSGPTVSVDLRQIGHVESKGRVQDKSYNPHLVVVDRLVAAGPAAIPYLVRKLEDDTKIAQEVFDFWSDVRVGDVALAILVDLFTKSDWKTVTVPGLAWDKLLDKQNSKISGEEALRSWLARHGRRKLRQKVEQTLQPYEGRFMWDASERCFRPEGQ